MNILYCGDKNIIDGLIISILSILKNTKEKLYIYVLTMNYKTEKKKYEPLNNSYIEVLNNLVKKYNKDNFVKLIDITDIVYECLPKANLNTNFTPFCMLRLYADQVKELPDKILYLDNDVVALKDPKELYNIDNSNYEVVGALDYYGSIFFRKKLTQKDYLNSGVLLLNLDLIRKNKLFEKSRNRCRKVKMMLPDQTAINIYSNNKLIVDRRFNEQKQIDNKTVFRHFTTTFKFWPVFHTQKVKPWDIDRLHNILHEHKIDDVLDDYKQVVRRIKNE